jgi:hypothetical protein
VWRAPACAAERTRASTATRLRGARLQVLQLAVDVETVGGLHCARVRARRQLRRGCGSRRSRSRQSAPALLFQAAQMEEEVTSALKAELRLS